MIDFEKQRLIILIVAILSLAIMSVAYVTNMASIERYNELAGNCNEVIAKCNEISVKYQQCKAQGEGLDFFWPSEVNKT